MAYLTNVLVLLTTTNTPMLIPVYLNSFSLGVSRQILGPTYIPPQWVPCIYSPQKLAVEGGADQKHALSAGFENAWIYNFTPQCVLMAQSFIK
jgi:hypothetical protein